MSDNILSQEVTDTNLETCHIGTLRSIAKAEGIVVQRDWTRKDIVNAVKAGRGEPVEADDAEQTIDDEDAINQMVFGASKTEAKKAADSRPKPGFAKVLIHKDPTPGHANSPVPVALNGRMIFIPRGVPVDVQIEYVGVLRDAVHTIVTQKKEPTQNNPNGEVTEEDILSYPFQVLSVTPGKSFRSDVDQRAKHAQRRQRFAETFHHWPTKGELDEWEKTLIAQRVKN